MKFKEKTVNFLSHIVKNKFVTKDSQKIVSGMDYHVLVWNLRDAGFIKNDGITKDNAKIWILTEKGQKVAQLLPELKKAFDIEKKIEEIMRE